MNKLKWISIAVIFALFAAIFIIRASYKPEPIVTNNIAVSGLVNGLGIRAGEKIGDVYVSVPDHLKSDELISVTTDGEIACLKLENMIEDDRVIRASVIGKGVGIAEIYVASADGKTMSEKFTVNVYSDVISENDTTNPDDTVIQDLQNIVYVTPSGKKYHLSKQCAGSTATSLELTIAVEKGYLPCKSCAVKK